METQINVFLYEYLSNKCRVREKIIMVTCSNVTPSDLSIPTCSPNTASFMVAL